MFKNKTFGWHYFSLLFCTKFIQIIWKNFKCQNCTGLDNRTINCFNIQILPNEEFCLKYLTEGTKISHRSKSTSEIKKINNKKREVHSTKRTFREKVKNVRQTGSNLLKLTHTNVCKNNGYRERRVKGESFNFIIWAWLLKSWY